MRVADHPEGRGVGAHFSKHVLNHEVPSLKRVDFRSEGSPDDVLFAAVGDELAGFFENFDSVSMSASFISPSRRLRMHRLTILATILLGS